MIIDSQDEGRSPIKKDDTSPVASAPPPYTLTLPPNPIPSYQAIHPASPVAAPRRPSPFRRFLRAFAIAILVLFLWGAFLDSLNKVARHFPSGSNRHGHYEIATSPACEECPCRCHLQKGIDDTGRILPIKYPPPPMTG